jgi:hypothetical protein
MGVHTLPCTQPYFRWANQVLYSPGSIMPPRRIYDHEVVYVVSGQGEIIIVGQAHAALAYALPIALISRRRAVRF